MISCSLYLGIFIGLSCNKFVYISVYIYLYLYLQLYACDILHKLILKGLIILTIFRTIGFYLKSLTFCFYHLFHTEILALNGTKDDKIIS